MFRKGFTLIELLIVIAIILILIAIALPNFMNARLRAKVLQTQADMRTVDTAIHFCANDYPGGINEPTWLCNNRNSPIGWNCDQIGNVEGAGTYAGWVMIHFGNFNPGVTYMGALLTTPISYIESCPLDFFNTAMGNQPPIVSFGFPSSFFINIWSPGSLAGGHRPWEQFWFEFMEIQHPRIKSNFWFSLESAGPDLKWWSNGVGAEKLYSPTNGAKSPGDIWRFSNGVTAP